MQFINQQWVPGEGEAFHGFDPATAEHIWEGHEATAKQVDQAVSSARQAFKGWAAKSFEERLAYLEKFKTLLEENKEKMAEAISKDAGKPTWEALTEAGAMIGKLGVSVKAYEDRCKNLEGSVRGARSITRFKPHGVLAVFGPFNFPGHLPNGHILPALLAGNVVIFKPSEWTPLVAELTLKLWEQADLPAGVIQLAQGARSTGEALANHDGIDGVCFTGSSRTGQIFNELFAKRPGKILALEMGGNNPLVVHEVNDVKAAAYATIQSAYITAGQRCTCARRLIVPEGQEGDSFLEALVSMTQGIQVGHYSEKPEPFMGPVINHSSSMIVVARHDELVSQGATSLIEPKILRDGTGLISPGLIDVTAVKDWDDSECFGPYLHVKRTKDFESAIVEANNTAYGLSAGLLSDSEDHYQTFWQEIRAGIVNWNNQLTGAAGTAPFGGVGLSGNHRPSAYFAADYCAFPVASLELESLSMPETVLPGLKGI